jgi:hypothetical protein
LGLALVKINRRYAKFVEGLLFGNAAMTRHDIEVNRLGSLMPAAETIVRSGL